MNRRLYEELLKIKDDDMYPFHMPGHKRNMESINPYQIDITEIDGFDNLHDAKELIKEAEERAARLYKSEETHFLVNGSTCGVLSAIFSVTERGDKIIVARNCHISVYNAIELNELKPVYVYPEIINVCDDIGINSLNYSTNFEKEAEIKLSGSVSKSEIEKAIINNPDAKAVIITSPTYDGVLSDVASIARIAHEYDMPLIVDEAHGALFYIEGRSALINGADLVINSVHKTLSALTQTALIHVNGKLVDRNKLRRYLRIFQTSSPSYVLMGSIDEAISIMEKEGNRLYREFCIRTLRLKDSLVKLKNLKFINKDFLTRSGSFDFDESKILIASADKAINGKTIYKILREKYKLQPEMAAGQYVLLMTTLFDTDEGIDRLIKALLEIDRELEKKSSEYERVVADIESHEFERVATDIESHEFERLEGKLGKPSEYTVFAYPPGIPIIVKGEIVTKENINEIKESLSKNLDVKLID